MTPPRSRNIAVIIPIEATTEDGTDLKLTTQPNKIDEDLFVDVYQGKDFWFSISVSELKQLVKNAEIMQNALDECGESEKQ